MPVSRLAWALLAASPAATHFVVSRSRTRMCFRSNRSRTHEWWSNHAIASRLLLHSTEDRRRSSSDLSQCLRCSSEASGSMSNIMWVLWSSASSCSTLLHRSSELGCRVEPRKQTEAAGLNFRSGVSGRCCCSVLLRGGILHLRVMCRGTVAARSVRISRAVTERLRGGFGRVRGSDQRGRDRVE